MLGKRWGLWWWGTATRLPPFRHARGLVIACRIIAAARLLSAVSVSVPKSLGLTNWCMQAYRERRGKAVALCCH